jgi:glycosyltransferase involved in cell wall biosynthesis
MRTSVLINTYNQAAYLTACIESVLAQTHPADEIIVYDDGSNDGSLEVLHSFGDKITVIPGKRVARASAINQGHAIHQAFLNSTGDVVFLLDGDDLFLPTRIAAYVKAFQSEPHAILVQAPLAWIEADGRPAPRLIESFRHADDSLAATYRRQDPDLFYPTSALAFSREFLLKALPIDWSDGINLWSDTRLCLVALLAGPIVTLPSEYGVHRKHAGSDSTRAAHSRIYQVAQTWRRTRVFNKLCRKSGHATLSVWKNPRFYLQLLRLLSPSGFYQAYAIGQARRRKIYRRAVAS